MMSASASSSSRWALALLAVLAAGCVDEEGRLSRTTSLKVTVTAPASLGTEQARLPDTTRSITVDVRALDDQGAVDATFLAPVDVQVHTLGTLTSTTTRIDLSHGMGSGSIAMPISFGKTFLWIEDITDTPLRTATWATGTSPVLWYREPLLGDVSTPDPTQSTSNQLRFSKLSGKQVRVSSSRYGAEGRLLVTGVFADGFSVSDVKWGQPSTVAPFDHVYVFSFGRPVDVRGRAVVVGQTLKWVEGAVAEFNGFTELNFPTQEIDQTTTDPSFMPVPVAVDKAWLDNATRNLLKLEEQESGLMQVTNVVGCALDRDDDYDRFKEWKVNIGLGCSVPITVLSAGTVSTFDPSTTVGKTIPKIVGVLKTVNLGSLNVWILLPRSAADIVLQ